MFYGIGAKKKGSKRKYMFYNFSSDKFFKNIFFQTLWNNEAYAKTVIESLKKKHKDLEFIVKKQDYVE